MKQLSFDAALNLIEAEVLALLKTKPHVTLAIDGRCAAGKTTLATELSKRLCASVISCDDFFLPPEKRTEERLSEIGGNMERERLVSEVLCHLPISSPLSYRRFDCHTASYSPALLWPSRVTIVEGSYSCHEDLRPYYDIMLFLSLDKDKQIRRIQKRNPDKLEDFFTKWIPMEERYFALGEIEKKATLVLSVENF